MVVGENVVDLVVGKGSLLIVRDGDRELGFGFPDFRFGFFLFWWKREDGAVQRRISE